MNDSTAASRQSCDVLIERAYVLTLDSANNAYPDGCLAITGDRVVAVGTTKELNDAYAPKHRVLAANRMVIPGIINPHNHSPLNGVRGMIEDLGYAPAYTPGVPQGHMLSAEEAYHLSRLGVYEMLRAGCTTLGDWYWQPDSLARAADESGIRAYVSGRIMDVDTYALARGEWRYDDEIGDRTIQQTVDLVERWHTASEGRIRCFIGVHAADTSSISQLRRVADLADSYKLDIHTHLHQNEKATQLIVERDGRRPCELWDDLGLLNDKLIAAHCLFVNDDDVSLVGSAGVTVIHVPFGNIQAGTMANVQKLESAGARIALATDTSSADMFETMRCAISVARVQGGGYAVSARSAIRWAFQNAAAALRSTDQIGSIEVGKKADLTFLDRNAPNLAPLIEGVGMLVWSANSGNVTDVMVGGRFVLKDRLPTLFDGDEVIAQAQSTAERLWARARNGVRQ